MKKNVLFVIMLIAAIFMVSCEDSTSSKKSDFVGIWTIKAESVNLTVTTNSDQTGLNIMAEGIGSIEVTGDINKTLKYLVNQYGYMIVSEYSAYSETSFTEGVTLNFDGTSIMLTKYDENNPMQSEYYQCDEAVYSYNTETYTLTVSPTTLYKLDLTTYQIDSTSTVQISGTLQSNAIEFKAGEPQKIEWLEGFGEESTIAINDDGTYTITSEEYEGETDVTVGTWEEKNGKLLFTEEDEEYGMDMEYVMDYKFDGNDLIINFDMDFCTDLYGYEESTSECYYYLEEMLMIETGSVSDAVLGIEMELSAK